jgi:hypothetical protein
MATPTFADYQTWAKDLEGSVGQRNQMFEELENIYNLEPGDLPDEDWIKDTISPDPRNELLGALRLLTSADPEFTVPTSTNNPQTRKVSSKLERFAAASYQAICDLAGKPIHYDIGLSGLLYGEVHLLITLTQDMVAAAKTPAQKMAAAEAAANTPFLIEVVNPSNGYPQWGKTGLLAYYSRQEKTVAEIRDMWGPDVQAGKKASDRVDYHDYFDMETHCAWADGESEPYIMAPHNLPFIPVVAVITEGSKLFTRADQHTRQPFLFTLWKSHLWERQNLSLTMMYSLIFAIGANPLFVYKRNTPEKKAPFVDYSTPGSRVVIDTNEDYYPLAKQILDPSLLQGLQTSEQKSEESTIYRQTLGEPMGANAPFSTVALLSQSGRLPLTSYQRMCSFAIGRAMKIGMVMAKKIAGGKLNAMGKGGMVDLPASEIPEQFTLEAKLDVSMPQDDRQNAQVAMQLAGGDNPMTSMRYARERFLHIGQSDDMDREIIEERFLRQQIELEMQQQMQQSQLPPGGGAVPPEMPGPAGPGGQIPPEMLDQLQQTGAEPGLPGMMAGAPMDPRGMPPGSPAGPGGPGQMGGL